MPRVLVVDDDESMRHRLENLLSQVDNLSVDLAGDAASARGLMATHVYQLALVDIELGSGPQDKYAGLGLLHDLNEKGCTILVVSGTAEDNLRGVSITLHAYDFIGKPINEQQFLHRVQHALSYANPNGKHACSGGLPDGLAVDPKNKLGLTWKTKPVRLSLTELSIVRCLVETPGKVVSHSALSKAMKSTVARGALATHISNIRSKFRGIDANFDQIDTEPGKGYFWKSAS